LRWAAGRDFRRLDRQVQREILNYMEKRIATAGDPRSFGKPLRQSKFGLRRFRFRDYRTLCQLKQSRLVVLFIAIGHRSKIYDD